MIDYMNIPVWNLASSKVFYDTVLAPLGLSMVAKDGAAIGYGKRHWSFGIEQCEEKFAKPHFAYIANSENAVDKFHAATEKIGAKSIGEPGIWPYYVLYYYAAYLLDPNSHNVEAFFRE
tara:strand:+ start:434 stop:790 length:357 start_codon:yes stop_codon:yes gene_type:complete